MSEPVQFSLANLMTGAAPAAAAPVTAPPAVATAAPAAAPAPAPAPAAGPQLVVNAPVAATVVGGGTTVVGFGQKVESNYVTRFRGVKGYTKRFAVLNPNRVFVSNTHYAEGQLKNFHCFGGACCKTETAKQSYLVPGLAYDTDKDGNPCSPKISIEYLKCSPGQWDLLTMLHRSQPIDQIDLFILCEDDAYQKIKIVPAGLAVWRQEANRQWAMAVIAEYNVKVDRILRSEAKYLGKLPDDLNDVAEMARYRKECESAFAKAQNAAGDVAAGAAHAAAEQRPTFDMAQFLAKG